ncbi:efflux RND transporter periplasmic adaptor subunit [Paenibacillus albiflavus]|nr:efflux RND transporter periplasmic adaptor subunit [Paenibacillus albiflavus]
MNEFKPKKTKWIILACSIIVLVGVGGYIYIKSTAKQTVMMTTSTVQSKQSDIKITISGSGATAAAEHESVKGGDGGKIAELLVQKGSIVKKGQPLVTFEGKDVKDQIYQEELSLQKKVIDLDDAKDKLKSNEDMNKIDDLKNNIRKLQLDIDLSNSKISSYKKDQQAPDPIVSPIDGEITVVNNKVGDQINGSAVICEIVNYNKLQLDIQVDEMDILKVKTGQTTEVTVDALPKEKFQGEVIDIAKEGESKNGVSLYSVTLQINDPGEIKAGMSARAEIIVENKTNVVVVPIEAVQQRQGKSFVLVDDGTSKQEPASTSAARQTTGTQTPAIQTPGTMREVTIGIQNETYAEIVSGLKAGENVIIPNAAATTGNANTRRQNGQMPVNGIQMDTRQGVSGGGGFSPGGGGTQNGNAGNRR